MVHMFCLKGWGELYLYNPAIRGILITARDITARKRVEERLSVITRLFENISSSLPRFYVALLDHGGVHSLLKPFISCRILKTQNAFFHECAYRIVLRQIGRRSAARCSGIQLSTVSHQSMNAGYMLIPRYGNFCSIFPYM
jgi:hypothetical protein